MKKLLLDIGSTFIKYAVYEKEKLFESSVPFPEPSVNNGVRFVVPLWEIEERVREIFCVAADAGCCAAYISVQMHGYAVRYKNGGFSDYISWRDKSGDCENSILDSMDFALLGTSRKNNLPMIKLIKEKGIDEFYTLGSYICGSLTGRNFTHITDACASGFFCADTGEYSGVMGDVKMPEVCRRIQPAGKYKGMDIYAPMGDHQISFLGSGAGADKYLLNVGTATQLSCIGCEEFSVSSAEKRPFFQKGERLCTVSGLTGGAVLYEGKGRDRLVKEVFDAIEVLPRKSGLLIGGGGGEYIYGYLKNSLAEKGIDCCLLNKNIGEEGLKMIAEKASIKAGIMLSELAFVNFPIIVKNSGLDFFIIDNEHGAFDYSTLSAITVNSNLAGIRAVVRVGDSSRANITKLADMGAKGFLLPMTDTKEDISSLVEYAMYSPIGKRGVSTTRAHTLYDPPALSEYMEKANGEMEIYAQIETKAGVENAEEIFSVKGVKGVFIGPNDLAVDLGCVSDIKPVKECIKKVAEAAQKTGKPWGIITNNPKLIDHSLQLGINMISYGSELNLLINGCKKIREEF